MNAVRADSSAQSVKTSSKASTSTSSRRAGGAAQGQPRGQVQRVVIGLQVGHQGLHRPSRRLAAAHGCQGHGQTLQRVGARPHHGDGPTGAAFQPAGLEGGQKSGAGQRRLAAAGGAEDGQETVLLAGGRAPQGGQQPPGEGLAAEEEAGVGGVEALQAAVGAFPFEDRLAGGVARLDAADAADQAAIRLRFVERGAELDPGRADEKSGQEAAFGPRHARQQHRNDAEAVLRIAARLAVTRRLMAARISSSCHAPMPPEPMNTAQEAHSASTSSMAGIHRSPGMRCH